MINSPNGLWQLYCANIIQYPFSSSNPNVPPIMLDNYGHATFEGPVPPQYPAPNPFNASVSIGTSGGYQQFFDTAGSINASNPLNYGYLLGANWWGNSSIAVTSIPDLNDSSTWTWTAEYKASGDSLRIVVPVPEPSTISLGALAGIIGMVSTFGKRRKLL